MDFYRFATALVYYGLALNAGNISGDIFLNNALNGILEILAYFILQFLMDRFLFFFLIFAASKLFM